jgi:hypothetical protein
MKSIRKTRFELINLMGVIYSCMRYDGLEFGIFCKRNSDILKDHTKPIIEQLGLSSEEQDWCVKNPQYFSKEFTEAQGSRRQVSIVEFLSVEEDVNLHTTTFASLPKELAGMFLQSIYELVPDIDEKLK